ncbi:MAG: hypothetical protein ACYDH6_21550 [Acidimicrobiales bacterium]
MRLDPGARLRASASWRLVVLDRLAAAERDAIRTQLGSDVYGVLLPRELDTRRQGDARRKVVGPDTALLFLTLGEPLVIPTYVRETFAGDADDAVAELVADEILEVEIDGRWVTGAAAFQALPSADVLAKQPLGGDTIAERSLWALRAAAVFPGADERTLTSFLYRFAATPMSPSRARAWGDERAIRAALRLDDIGLPTLSSDKAWWVFAGDAGDRTGPSPKLYVGVALAHLAEATRRMVALWRKTVGPTPALKIGANASGLHRVDRVVIYPSSPGEAVRWARLLSEEIDDLAADPVPFTSGFDASGRVSTGLDPAGVGRAWWEDDGSWRSSLTRTLGAAIAAARAARAPDPIAYATERARLSGIDPQRWCPIETAAHSAS